MSLRAYVDLAKSDLPATAWLKKFDYDSNNYLIYEGWAAPGSLTSTAVWAIRKYTYSGSNLVTTQWADGDTNEDNMWDNRVALTYL